MTAAAPTAPRWEVVYRVPRSQVHPGSVGGQSGGVHLRLHGARVTLTAVVGRRGTIERRPGRSLCDAAPPPRGRYERPPDPAELREQRCPRCVAMGRRYGIVWPEVD